MSRFREIVRLLRIERVRLVEENRSKKADARRGVKKPKKHREVRFDSPELEAIFKNMPKECQDLLR